MAQCPCYPGHKSSPICKDGTSWSYGYSKWFLLETKSENNGYLLYWRGSAAEGGQTMTVGEHPIVNIWILPYWPLLFKFFNSKSTLDSATLWILSSIYTTMSTRSATSPCSVSNGKFLEMKHVTISSASTCSAMSRITRNPVISTSYLWTKSLFICNF